MPPFFPPPGILVLETAYFLVISFFCIVIYFTTSDIYRLSKHKGIFHFRNIFLFFALAYFFRLINFSMMFPREFFGMARAQPLFPLAMLMFSYFSTMAILSLVMTLLVKKIKTTKRVNILLHLVAIFSSIIVFVTRSHPLLLLIQTLIFLISAIYVIRGNHKGIVSKNRITYILLFVFWVLNVIISMRGIVPWEYKIPLYVVSIAIFFSIFTRVHKRLANVKKKG